MRCHTSGNIGEAVPYVWFISKKDCARLSKVYFSLNADRSCRASTTIARSNPLHDSGRELSLGMNQAFYG